MLLTAAQNLYARGYLTVAGVEFAVRISRRLRGLARLLLRRSARVRQSLP